MNLKSKILSQRLIARFFLLAFTGVFAANILCNIDFHSLLPITHEHEHSHGSHQDDEDHHHHDSKDQSNKDDDCCSDFTSYFLTDFDKQVNSPYQFKVPLSQVKYKPFQVLFTVWPVKESDKLTVINLPPPKVPDIRIFIQSFII